VAEGTVSFCPVKEIFFPNSDHRSSFWCVRGPLPSDRSNPLEFPPLVSAVPNLSRMRSSFALFGWSPRCYDFDREDSLVFLVSSLHPVPLPGKPDQCCHWRILVLGWCACSNLPCGVASMSCFSFFQEYRWPLPVSAHLGIKSFLELSGRSNSFRRAGTPFLFFRRYPRGLL